MNFLMNKIDLVTELGIADTIINPRTPLAVLLNVYIEAHADGSIIFLTYNGDNGLKIESAGMVEQAGGICVRSKKLLEMIRTLPGEKLVLETDPHDPLELMVHPEGVENPIFRLKGIATSTYPTFNEFNWEEYLVVAQETIHEQIESTEFCVSHDITKIAFTGTYVEESVEGMLTFVSTDGKRLAVITRPIEHSHLTDLDKPLFQSGVIIPQKVLAHTLKLCLRGKEDLWISVRGGQIYFRVGNIYIFTNLVQGKFPNYKDVIPEQNDTPPITVNAAYLRNALELTSIMSDENTGRLCIDVQPNALCVSSSQHHGGAKQEIAVDYDGEAMSFALNCRALTDFLRVVGGKKIQIFLYTPNSPILLKAVGEEDYLFVAVPMKLGD